jgi:hypothetical protein
MSVFSTLRSSKSRRVALGLTGVIALLAVAALAGCSAHPAGPHAASVVQSTASVAKVANNPSLETAGVGTSSSKKTFSVVLNVQNHSKYTMNWVGDSLESLTPDSPPLNIAPGGTDRIVFQTSSASGIHIEPTWRVDGTEFTVYPTVGDPTIGTNAVFCTVDEVAKGSPVVLTGCKIGSGYHPDVQIAFSNR